MAAAALLTTGALAAGPLAASAAPLDPDLARTVHTAGRVAVGADGGALFSWPGIYLEGRFEGTGIGVDLTDPASDYDVAIDGERVTTLVAPGPGTHWVDGLAPGQHTVRVVKRSESTWTTSRFDGFVAAPGGRLLDAPPARERQLELVGDSFTAGYGNESTERECTGDQVNRTTNADLSFGAITARNLDADYQVNAFSGRGMVRNYGGGEAGTSYRTYADRALLAVPGDVWDRPDDWQPDAVVIGLGINDFSTPVSSGEPWTTQSLRTAYVEAYTGFLDTLRARYGPQTYLVVSSTSYAGPELPPLVQEVVAQQRAAGDQRVLIWDYADAPLDYLGCHWHPSLADHRVLAQRLTALLTPLLTDPQPTPTATPTPSGSPTGSPTTLPSPTVPARACQATLTVVGSWPGGYQASVRVTAGPSGVAGWRAGFSLPGGSTVVQGWSADFTSAGPSVTATSKDWNARLGAGQTAEAGFIGSGPVPTDVHASCTSP
ncbi:cellulose binding domain-containing protein [Cellulomonas sp. DKR-3]|uniref:Cellulose binding domain-containing protein n=1 Tax=Cellulomonas fulva TaxID=2835530 RepID=A0ABS5TW04_9CELL|nr:cellulose binding domain-containing protein [Cellulomonas fulva]